MAELGYPFIFAGPCPPSGRGLSRICFTASPKHEITVNAMMCWARIKLQIPKFFVRAMLRPTWTAAVVNSALRYMRRMWVNLGRCFLTPLMHFHRVFSFCPLCLPQNAPVCSNFDRRRLHNFVHFYDTNEVMLSGRRFAQIRRYM